MEKRYNHKVAEKDIQEWWNHTQPYKHTQHEGPLYSIDTPPPTVSGNLHIGHIFSYTQADIIARYKRMQGYSVFYPFGFDDNGLPTERYVEKKHKTNAVKVGRQAFIKLCLQETEQAAQMFKELWQRMGLSVDWDATYSTISARVRKISQESFVRLYQQGIVYKKFEPALYCTTCRTSVAQAELEDVQKPSTFNTITFVAEGQDVAIATTRPELLPACVAIFYHPSDERYTHLQDTYAQVPLFDKRVPCIPDELVDPQKGTGLVMCCAFGDKTDVAWIKKYDLSFDQIISYNGRLIDKTGLLDGLTVADARQKVLQELEKAGCLVEQKQIEHAVNVHERCKKEIEYVALSQWFLSILPLKNELLRLGQEVTWHPEFMYARYKNWVEHISWDWCLSRQRVYGIPFPAWHCTACTHIIVATQDMLPIDPQESMYPGGVCPACGSDNVVPETDVMDTWNTSSLTPFIVYDVYTGDDIGPFEKELAEGFFPMSLRPQAHDIIRTWAFYTIVKAYLHNRTIPWRSIMVSGHVLTEGKEKLSKSQEQKKMDPHFLLEHYSADAIRYWTASASLGNDTLFSETQLKLGQRLITKLWNAFRFMGEHMAYTADQAPTLDMVNAWILTRASQTYQKYMNCLDEYAYNAALDVIEQFFWHDVCDNYIELIKHQLFNPHEYSVQEVEATRWSLYQLGLRILQLYAPFVPFVTEEIFKHLYQEHTEKMSVHMTKFAEVQERIHEEQAVKFMQYFIDIVSLMRKAKTEQKLSLGATIKQLTITSSNAALLHELESYTHWLKGIARADHIAYVFDSHQHETIVSFL